MGFENCAPLDFTIAKNRNDFEGALTRLASAEPQTAFPLIEGQRVDGGETISVENPSHTESPIGTVSLASVADSERALTVLRKGFPAWRDTSSEERADILFRLADLLEGERNDLSALIVLEAGKPWREADADVVEAIDFCRYYADIVKERMSKPLLVGEVLGEQNFYFYEPRGVALVISPWNFPLAIACGMTVASLVTGNTTVLKPAEQTSLIAYRFAQLVYQAGFPKSSFAFLPGIGETVGAALVDSPDVDLICFTGSKAVGLHIISKAAEVHPGQRNVKRVIAEMGGKNAIIVDEDADLDEAVKGVLASAFGFSGQKCSACSRVIAVGSAYEVFVKRLCEAASDIVCGAAADPASYFGPVIDAEAHQRILATIEAGERELKLGFRGEAPKDGYYVPATIFRDVPTSAPIWREEIFGPVLACRKADSIEEALKVALDSPYALTGGLFSRSPKNIALIRKEFRVGNLYINRTCTGAIVGRQPFGGAKMSGVGSKAGGPDYLLQFTEPRTITENTMRRGFTPELA